MIERLNAATNLIAFLLVAIGATLSIWHPEVANPIITGAFGLLVGHGLANSQKQAPKPTEEKDK